MGASGQGAVAYAGEDVAIRGVRRQGLLGAQCKRTGARSASDGKTSDRSKDEESKIEAHLRESGCAAD
jgi:hypothetical protein